jgi:drug/metabolite transporter (DMT)-like permease
VSGTLLAAAAGVGFGVFQTLNRRAVGGMSDAYLATFLQLLVALLVLAVATLATTDLELLAEATAAGIAFFALAGLVHFFVGWTLLNMSQMRIGAARTSPLLSTNPLFGVVVAAVTIQEVPETLGWLGIGLIMAGAGRARSSGSGPRSPGRSAPSSSRRVSTASPRRSSG